MKIEEPKVAIVCAWYNRANYLRDTVDSLLLQDFDSFQVVIVNDGSTDSKVKDILDGYKDPKLKVIHQKNSGFVSAIKRAIEESSAPFIAIQGAGDISLPQRVSQQYAKLVGSPELVGVGAFVKSNYVYEDGVETDLSIKKSSKLLVTRNDFMAKRNPLSQGEVMFKRSAYITVGGYRETFKYAQDRDLWLRLSELGDFAICDEVLYVRRSFEKDGVSTDLNKLILQRKLSIFARQCAKKRDLDGVDYVDLYGRESLLMYKQNFLFDEFVFKEFLKCIAAENLIAAKEMFCVARHHKSSFLSHFLFLVEMSILYVPFIRVLVRKLLPFFSYSDVSVRGKNRISR